jgi:glutamate:GABA antiporter
VTTLVRTLRPWDVVWFLVSAVVGLRWIATAAAAGPSALTMWVVAAATFYVPLSYAVIHLSERHPNEGGLYVWVQRAFGDFAGFMAGWMYWMSTVVYFNGLLYFGAGAALFVLDPTGRTLADRPAYFVAASLAALAVALALNLRGLRAGTWLHNVGGWSTWIPVAVLIALGGVALARFGSATPIDVGALVPHATGANLAFWSTLAFGFGGFEAVAFMGDEIVDTAPTIRRAVVVAGAMTLAIYILGTAAVLVAVPSDEVSGLQGIMQAIAAVAGRTGWTVLTPLLAFLIALGTLGGVSAWLASTSRLPFVAGVDRALPPAFGRLHPRWGTPWVALSVQAVVSAVVAVLGQAGTSVQGAYDVLVSLGVISYFIPYVLMFAAQWRLDPRGRSRGLALVGLTVTVVSMALAAVPAPDESHRLLALVKIVGGTVGLLAAGALLFQHGRRRAGGEKVAVASGQNR